MTVWQSGCGVPCLAASPVRSRAGHDCQSSWWVTPQILLRSFCRICVLADEGSSGKASPSVCCFSEAFRSKSLYTQLVHLGVVCLEPLHLCFGVTCPEALQLCFGVARSALGADGLQEEPGCLLWAYRSLPLLPLWSPMETTTLGPALLLVTHQLRVLVQDQMPRHLSPY